MIDLKNERYEIRTINKEQNFVILTPNDYKRKDILIHLGECSIENFLFSNAELFESSLFKLVPVEGTDNEYNLVRKN